MKFDFVVDFDGKIKKGGENMRKRVYIEYIKNGVTYDYSIHTTDIYKAIEIFKGLQGEELKKVTYISACYRDEVKKHD